MRTAISSLSSRGVNPYLDLLYEALAERGIRTGPEGRLDVRWLLAQRTEVRYLHANWPQGLYRFERGPSLVRPYLSWLKVAILEARLRLARALSYRVIWTVHQVYPHGRTTRLDRVGARLLARNADVLLAHDPETASRARRELAPYAESVAIVPHGSYIDVYPAGRTRLQVRKALGIAENSVVYLCFGELRSNSELDTLIEAFSRLPINASALVIAGNARDRHMGDAAAAAAATDDRVVRINGFVPFEQVRELYESADVAVVPRGDGGTSGSLILALSLATPVIAADTPAYRRLLEDGAAGWLFRAGDASDLCSALEAAASDETSRQERANAARRIALGLDWRDAASQLASLLAA